MSAAYLITDFQVPAKLSVPSYPLPPWSSICTVPFTCLSSPPSPCSLGSTLTREPYIPSFPEYTPRSRPPFSLRKNAIAIIRISLIGGSLDVLRAQRHSATMSGTQTQTTPTLSSAALGSSIQSRYDDQILTPREESPVDSISTL